MFIWKGCFGEHVCSFQIFIIVCAVLVSVCYNIAYAVTYFDVTAKLVAVGYGIKKLQIMLTIIDDLVSVDNLIEDHLTAEPINEHVQSCDIVAFNKICKGLFFVA